MKLKKNQLKKDKKNDPSEPRLTCQARDLGHMIEIIQYKAN
jgi:hypothetical protein